MDPRERAAWTTAGWLGAALIAILTLMLGYIGSVQHDIIGARIDDGRRRAELADEIVKLREAVSVHLADHE